MFQNASDGSVVCIVGVFVRIIAGVGAVHELDAASREIESHLGQTVWEVTVE